MQMYVAIDVNVNVNVTWNSESTCPLPSDLRALFWTISVRKQCKPAKSYIRKQKTVLWSKASIVIPKTPLRDSVSTP
ncbi:hypothetical protein D3C76_1678650 [compost metagenome]